MYQINKCIFIFINLYIWVYKYKYIWIYKYIKNYRVGQEKDLELSRKSMLLYISTRDLNRCLTEIVPNKHENMLNLKVTGEMQIKTNDAVMNPLEWLKLSRLTIPSVRKR